MLNPSQTKGFRGVVKSDKILATCQDVEKKIELVYDQLKLLKFLFILFFYLFIIINFLFISTNLPSVGSPQITNSNLGLDQLFDSQYIAPQFLQFSPYNEPTLPSYQYNKGYLQTSQSYQLPNQNNQHFLVEENHHFSEEQPNISTITTSSKPECKVKEIPDVKTWREIIDQWNIGFSFLLKEIPQKIYSNH